MVAVDFGLDFGRMAVNGAGSSSAGGSATAIVPKPSIDACGGTRQLQPIRVADSKPTRSTLIRFRSRHEIHFELLLVDLVAPISGGDWRPKAPTRFECRHSHWSGFQELQIPSSRIDRGLPLMQTRLNSIPAVANE